MSGILVLVVVAAAIAVGAFGFLLTTAPPTPIFSTGNPATDGGAGAAHTYTYPAFYNFAYESWLPSAPNTDNNITTIQVWMQRSNSSNGPGYIGVFLQGGGISDATCQNTDGKPGNGCYAVFSGTIVSPMDQPVLVTFDVSGLNWVRHASTSMTDIVIQDIGVNGDIGTSPPQGGYGIALLWASASSQGSGHQATHAGSRIVLTVSGGFSYYDIAMSVFATLAAPPAPLTADFTSSSSALTVSFASSVSGGASPYTYSWSYGGSGSAAGTKSNPVYTYTASGTYTVTLTVSDAVGHTASASHAVTVSTSYTSMSVDFTFTVDADGVTARFTSSVSHGLPPYTYSWAFGDAATSTSQNPVHAYAATGSYTATLSVTDTKPATVTATHTVQTNAQTPPPTASFSYTVQYLYVTLAGSATGGTSPYTYAWAFGDGQTSSAASTSHGYTAAGTYTVVFTVTDSKGLQGSQSRSVTVVQKVVSTPLTNVDFTSDNVGNHTMSFTSKVTGGNGTLSYSWNFGDGGTSTSGNPSYQFATPGSYTVNLTVRDSSGTSLSASHTVTVTAAPSAPLPWVQILGIVLAGVGATFAALMLEYKKLRKIHFVFGVVLLIALGAMLIAGVL